MHDKIIKIFTGFFALTLLIVFNSLAPTSNLFSSIIDNFISQAQETNSTENGTLSIGANHTVLSLIPLMIKEMENTNATTIPIKQVINATPSNVTALQNMAKNNLLNNINKNNIPVLNTTSSGSSLNNNSLGNNPVLNTISSGSMSNFNPINKTDLIPVVVNLTKNTNATDIAMAKTINATPSNVTAIQNMAKNNSLNNISSSNTINNILNNIRNNNSPVNNNNTTNSSNFNPINKTDLIPVVVNLTKNTNATDIAMAKTINATPSNVTALQNMAKNNSLNNISSSNTINNILNNIRNNNSPINNTNPSNSSNFNPINKTDLIPVVVNLTKNTNATDIAMAKTFNATPSNVTALQKFSKNNFLNNISNTMSNTMSLSNNKNPTR